MFGKFSNDTQENPKDALEFTNFHEKYTKPTEATELVETNQKLTAEKENLNNQLNASQKQVKELEQSQQVLKNVKTDLTNENTKLKNEKTELNSKNAELQKQVQALEQSQQVLKNENAELSKDKDNLTKDKAELIDKITRLSTEKENLTKEKTDLTNKNAELQKQVKDLQDSKQALKNEKTELSKEKENLTKANAELKTENDKLNQTSQKLKELEQRHAPYQKLEKLYEVFLEVKDRLNFNFVATTHSAMDLIASVLSDSKYYLESLYNKASQELSDKRSDKGEKLAELFDLLFEYIKDSKFERLKEPSAYDYSCKTLYPEQNSSQKIQRVVLRGYKHNHKVYHTIVDMGS
ncbi:hypothetical protein E5D93_00300 [Helicobacter pylori]|nr:hypothetical protein E5D93_00300 [Helicobacter pylori]